MFGCSSVALVCLEREETLVETLQGWNSSNRFPSMSLFLWNRFMYIRDGMVFGSANGLLLHLWSSILFVILFVIFGVLAAGYMYISGCSIQVSWKMKVRSESDQVRFNMSLKVKVICSCLLKIAVLFGSIYLWHTHVRGNRDRLESRLVCKTTMLRLPTRGTGTATTCMLHKHAFSPGFLP